jgi:hypothetical protein
MTIYIEHPEPYIIHARWQGVVTLDEIFEAGQEAYETIAEHGLDAYIHIIDGREVDRVPFEMRLLGKVIQRDKLVRHYIILGAPAWTKTITRIVGMLSRIPMEHYEDYDAAIERAREVRNTM